MDKSRSPAEPPRNRAAPALRDPNARLLQPLHSVAPSLRALRTYMLLRATHTTTYLYSEPVSICHTEAHLAPREHWGQTVLEHELSIVPQPDFSLTRRDYFGNGVAYFSIHKP